MVAVAKRPPAVLVLPMVNVPPVWYVPEWPAVRYAVNPMGWPTVCVVLIIIVIMLVYPVYAVTGWPAPVAVLIDIVPVR